MPAASALILVAACSWNNPGSNQYTGQVPDAVYSYTDIPRQIQDKLYGRMFRRDYDDIVRIGVRTISGAYDYKDLRQMHFAGNKLCNKVDRSKWFGRLERGLIYCEQEYCLIVPIICHNVSRITRIVVAPNYAEQLEKNFQTEEEEKMREILKMEEERQRRRMLFVPEPSSLILSIISLLIMYFSKEKSALRKMKTFIKTSTKFRREFSKDS